MYTENAKFTGCKRFFESQAIWRFFFFKQNHKKIKGVVTGLSMNDEYACAYISHVLKLVVMSKTDF